jgi:monovalent cation:proton antiporter
MKFTDVILQTATKVLAFIILIYAVYVLFAGHHNPGGGFVGGLVTASAIVLLYLAFDTRTVRQIIKADFKWVGAAGVLLAVCTGCAPLVKGEPFLSHSYIDARLPLIGEIHLATAVLFDIGVFLAVIGTTMTIMIGISEDE